MKQETLNALFIEQIRDIYDAEKQLVKALPKMVKAADSGELAEALRTHLGETEVHVSRLEEVFGIVGAPARAKPCNAMKGLIKEGDETVQQGEKGALRDLGIIAAAQRVEHYEISAYGTARALAEQLNIGEAAEILHETEDEEANADATLTTIAMSLYKTFNNEDSYDSEAVVAGASAVRAEHSGQTKKQPVRGARSA